MTTCHELESVINIILSTRSQKKKKKIKRKDTEILDLAQAKIPNFSCHLSLTSNRRDWLLTQCYLLILDAAALRMARSAPPFGACPHIHTPPPEIL